MYSVVTKSLRGAGFGRSPRVPAARIFYLCCGACWAVGQVSAVLAGLCMLESFSLLIIYLQIDVSI